MLMRADAVLTSWSYSPNQAAEDSGELLARAGAAAVALTEPEVSSLLGILLSCFLQAPSTMACTSPNTLSTFAACICLRTFLLAAIFSALVAACAFAARTHWESSASAIGHLVGTGIGTRAPDTAGGVACRVCAAGGSCGADR